jgi:hypothetical protein
MIRRCPSVSPLVTASTRKVEDELETNLHRLRASVSFSRVLIDLDSNDSKFQDVLSDT